MEKPKNRFWRVAQAAAISFQNLSFSPRRDKRPDVRLNFKTHHNKGFSGPMIPAEARRKSRNFETQEPRSPKVSCMGQIKHKNHKISNKRHVSLPKEFKPASAPRPGKSTKAQPPGPDTETKKKKKPSGVKKIFRRKARASASIDRAEPAESAPSLSQMRKFASSRDTFANFDWTRAQITPGDDREFYYSEGEDDVSIPFSAPILMTGGAGLDWEPRKEINLWKRRTMAPPKPLSLNMD